MGSRRGYDLADIDEEYGDIPRRDICDYSGAEGQKAGARENNEPAVQTQILLSASSSWDGEPYQSYPSGQPELSVLKIILAPHTQLEWHSHPMPSAAYIVAGELTLERKRDGKKQHFTAGQVISETVDTLHRGVAGNEPLVLIVFYARTTGMLLAHRP